MTGMVIDLREVQTARSAEEKLRRINRDVAEGHKLGGLHVRFREPVQKSDLEVIYGITLTSDMVAAGEEQQGVLAIANVHYQQRLACTWCRSKMRAAGPRSQWACPNRKCGQFGRIVTKLRNPGVSEILVKPQWVVDRQIVGDVSEAIRRGESVQGARVCRTWVNQAFVVMDRRYDPETLMAVYRAIGDLGSRHGWALEV